MFSVVSKLTTLRKLSKHIKSHAMRITPHLKANLDKENLKSKCLFITQRFNIRSLTFWCNIMLLLYGVKYFLFLLNNKYEPPRGKTNNVVSEQVRHKPTSTATEAG